MSSNSVSVGAGVKTAIVLAVILVIGAMGAFFIVRDVVPEGYAGVELDRDAATGVAYEPGWHYINPFTKDVELIETRPRTVTYSGDEEAITFLTDDGQDMAVDVTVRYRVTREDSVTFYEEGKSHDQALTRFLEPAVRSSVRDEGSDQAARTTISKDGRRSLEQAAEEALVEEFEGTGMTLEAVHLRDVRPNDEFSAELEQIEIENAVAEQRIIEAEGQAEAERVRAQGDRDAMRIRNEELTPGILALEQIGAYDSGTVYVTNGETPIIMDAESGGSGMPSVTGDDGPSPDDEPTNESDDGGD